MPSAARVRSVPAPRGGPKHGESFRADDAEALLQAALHTAKSELAEEEQMLKQAVHAEMELAHRNDELRTQIDEQAEQELLQNELQELENAQEVGLRQRLAEEAQLQEHRSEMEATEQEAAKERAAYQEQRRELEEASPIKGRWRRATIGHAPRAATLDAGVAVRCNSFGGSVKVLPNGVSVLCTGAGSGEQESTARYDRRRFSHGDTRNIPADSSTSSESVAAAGTEVLKSCIDGDNEAQWADLVKLWHDARLSFSEDIEATRQSISKLWSQCHDSLSPEKQPASFRQGRADAVPPPSSQRDEIRQKRTRRTTAAPYRVSGAVLVPSNDALRKVPVKRVLPALTEEAPPNSCRSASGSSGSSSSSSCSTDESSEKSTPSHKEAPAQEGPWQEVGEALAGLKAAMQVFSEAEGAATPASLRRSSSESQQEEGTPKALQPLPSPKAAWVSLNESAQRLAEQSVELGRVSRLIRARCSHPGLLQSAGENVFQGPTLEVISSPTIAVGPAALPPTPMQHRLSLSSDLPDMTPTMSSVDLADGVPLAGQRRLTQSSWWVCADPVANEFLHETWQGIKAADPAQEAEVEKRHQRFCSPAGAALQARRRMSV
mmetsp:Transcript_60724/g.112662  ORF Transcript_60724/g.112662 Transcript_60724/m.112662 type:complete len:606 (+) Transcript_60724:83-1900(+)